MDFPQQDYAALSMLTQAADAVNDPNHGEISNHHHFNFQQQHQHYNQQQQLQGTHSVSGVSQPHVHAIPRRRSGNGNRIQREQHGGYKTDAISARSMDGMNSCFNGDGVYLKAHHNHQMDSGRGYAWNRNGNGNGNSSGNEHLGILNAESYDDGSGAVRERVEYEARMMRGQQVKVLPFGIADEVGGGKKKRKVKHKPATAVAAVEVVEEKAEGPEEGEEDEDEARKKARGRPRVDTKDETPAERRRTQIRLAQRAYRNRKETAISSLEKKVQDLRGTNEEMSNIFINLYDFVVNRGVLGRDAELAQQFQAATERFVALAKAAGNDDSNQEENLSGENQTQDGAVKARKAIPKPEQEINHPVSELVSNPWGGYVVAKEDSPVYGMDLPVDHNEIQVIARATADNASFPFDFAGMPDVSETRSDIQVISRPTQDNASFPFDLMGLEQYRAEASALGHFPQAYMPTAFPPPPASFSFSETTLARRINRSTTEAALKLARMKNPPRVKYQRVFGITSMYESNDAIIARLTRVLANTAKETLQQWKEPFVHLGGSGTFYPVPESDRNSNLMPKIQSGYSMGPFSAEVSQVQDLIEDDMTIKLPEFRSDFFDSNDVEGYLRARGIEIPPAADYVNVEIDLSAFGEIPSRRNSSNNTTMVSPKTPHSHGDNVLLNNRGNESGAATGMGLSFKAGGGENMGFAQDYSNWNAEGTLGFQFDPVTGQSIIPGYQASPASNSVYSPRSIVTINVKTFVDELISRCVCLGRAAGYRPRDVNMALLAAIKAGFAT